MTDTRSASTELNAPGRTVTEAVESRRSLRAFHDTPVDPDVINAILQTAARAPSGVNIQPWHTHVLYGATRQDLCAAVCHAYDHEAGEHACEVAYYPSKWFEPYISRRRKVGWDLYGLLEIEKGDKARMHAQHRRNFQFFDAPVGLMFTIHRDLATGSWLDYGMFLQNIMLLVREAGLHSCAQAAWADYPDIIRRVLGIDEEQVIVCGMAVGHADGSAVENSLVTEREELSSFVTQHD